MKREDYISDETVIKRANEAVRIELEKNKALGVPVVIYDRESQIIYQENEIVIFAGPNGSGKKYIYTIIKTANGLYQRRRNKKIFKMF